MDRWQAELISIDAELCEHKVFRKIEAAVRALGYEQCALGLHLPFASAPTSLIVLNHCTAPQWLGCVSRLMFKPELCDPSLTPNQASKIWCERILLAPGAARAEMQAVGQRVDWLRSTVLPCGVATILTLSRLDDDPPVQELTVRQRKLRRLLEVAHITLCRIFTAKTRQATALTKREIEVLGMSADGKTSYDVAGLLKVSERTVNFHIDNALAKLGSTNKTAAVARALRLGYFA